MSSVSSAKKAETIASIPVKKGRIAPQLLVLLAALAFITALWSFMLITTSRQETLDQHVHRLASQLKCPVCQSESVADSSSSIAQEMRGVIRQKIQAGESDQQIMQFFIDRYGTQIAWSPPWWGFSLLAWLVPVLLLLGGIVIVAITLQQWQTSRAISAVEYRQGFSRDAEDILNEDELARYRAQLERELLEDDILFWTEKSTPEQGEETSK